MFKIRVYIRQSFIAQDDKPVTSVDFESMQGYDVEVIKIRAAGGLFLSDALFIPLHNILAISKINEPTKAN